MARQRARSGPRSGPTQSALKTSNDPFASHRAKHQHVQKFHFDAELFDIRDHDHQVALETIVVLNRGMRLDENFTYRGNVFIGEPENNILDLHWLAILLVDPDSGRHIVQLFQAQDRPTGSKRDFIARILNIRTGHEDNSGSTNSVQQARWHQAAKLAADWQMPISMITLATSTAQSPFNTDLRLFVPEDPESIYNTMALEMWRLTLGVD